MKAYVSEILGTFFLIFAGTGAIIINDLFGGSVTHLGVSLTFGLVVMALIYAFGDKSGAHFNPAVTCGFWLLKRFPGKQVFPYVLSQCVGGIGASLVLGQMFPHHPTLGATLPQYGLFTVFFLECLLMMFLMLVILSVATGSEEKGLFAGLAIGGTVGLEALFAGPVTGASMNPVRSLAPALVSGQYFGLWIYLTAPFLGAIIAVGIHRFLTRL